MNPTISTALVVFAVGASVSFAAFGVAYVLAKRDLENARTRVVKPPVHLEGTAAWDRLAEAASRLPSVTMDRGES